MNCHPNLTGMERMSEIIRDAVLVLWMCACASFGVFYMRQGRSMSRTQPKPVKRYLDIYLRLMSKSDLDRICEIEFDSYNEPWNRDEFKTLIKSDNHICSVAVVEGQVVGFLIYELSKNYFYLKSIAVSPKYRRMRIGTRLVERMSEMLSETNRKSCRVHIPESNLLGQKFLREMGFKATHVMRNFFDGDVDAYYFIKKASNGVVCGTQAVG